MTATFGAPTPSVRAALGRAARRRAPRSGHGDWQPAAGRDDPVKLLIDQGRGRVPELLPLRYGRMLVSPFAFYRGAAAIMAADLAATPTCGLDVQLCGDAHLSNFGTFSSPERALVFDISDFDETLPGPWEWDVKRLAASVCIAGRERGFDEEHVDRAVCRTVAAYREAMRGFARQGNLQVWYAHNDVDAIRSLFRDGIDIKRMRSLDRKLEKARAKTSVRELGKLTETVDGQVRFLSKPPLLVPVSELLTGADRADAESSVQDLLSRYAASLPADRRTLLRGYRYAAIARKVVGVGSVGMRAWVILMLGRDARDPLVLQAKEAVPSVLERHLGPAAAMTHSQRVVEGQQLMQAASDIFLGWLSARGPDGGKRDYYVRQLADGKGTLDVSVLLPAGLEAYGRLCGWTLARAHARSGDRVAIAGYLGAGTTFERAITAFAGRYADQNEADFKALQAAVAAGRVQAEQG